MKIKVCFNQEIYLLKLPKTLKELLFSLPSTFLSLLPSKWHLEYLNNSSQRVSIVSEEDYMMLMASSLANVKVFLIPNEEPETENEIKPKPSKRDIEFQLIENKDDSLSSQLRTQWKVPARLLSRERKPQVNQDSSSSNGNSLERIVEKVIAKSIPKIAQATKEYLTQASSLRSQLNIPDVLKGKFSAHKGTRCQGCGISPIIGIRYKCSICREFDYCEACEDTNDHPHALIKIKEPSQPFKQPLSGPSSQEKKAEEVHNLPARFNPAIFVQKLKQSGEGQMLIKLICGDEQLPPYQVVERFKQVNVGREVIKRYLEKNLTLWNGTEPELPTETDDEKIPVEGKENRWNELMVEMEKRRAGKTFSPALFVKTLRESSEGKEIIRTHCGDDKDLLPFAIVQKLRETSVGKELIRRYIDDHLSLWDGKQPRLDLDYETESKESREASQSRSVSRSKKEKPHKNFNPSLFIQKLKETEEGKAIINICCNEKTLHPYQILQKLKQSKVGRELMKHYLEGNLSLWNGPEANTSSDPEDEVTLESRSRLKKEKREEKDDEKTLKVTPALFVQKVRESEEGRQIIKIVCGEGAESLQPYQIMQKLKQTNIGRELLRRYTSGDWTIGSYELMNKHVEEGREEKKSEKSKLLLKKREDFKEFIKAAVLEEKKKKTEEAKDVVQERVPQERNEEEEKIVEWKYSAQQIEKAKMLKELLPNADYGKLLEFSAGCTGEMDIVEMMEKFQEKEEKKD